MPNPRIKSTIKGLVDAAVVINPGDLITIVGGYWSPVTATTGLTQFAIAANNSQIDNTAGAAGDFSIDVEWVSPRYLVLMANDTVAPIAATDLGGPAYGKDATTVSSDGTGRSQVGIAWEFANFNLTLDTTRVWVEVA